MGYNNVNFIVFNQFQVLPFGIELNSSSFCSLVFDTKRDYKHTEEQGHVTPTVADISGTFHTQMFVPA